MSKHSLFKKVCKQICYAQLASDAAKGIRELELKNEDKLFEITYRDRHTCYDKKDNFILNAVTLLDNNRPFGINYYLIDDYDQNGYNCNIIYFDIKLDTGERIQISFHSFNEYLAKRLNKKTEKGRKTNWDHGSSRKNCEWLINHFGF